VFPGHTIQHFVTLTKELNDYALPVFASKSASVSHGSVKVKFVPDFYIPPFE